MDPVEDRVEVRVLEGAFVIVIEAVKLFVGE
jgi:hypothetical protein